MNAAGIFLCQVEYEPGGLPTKATKILGSPVRTIGAETASLQHSLFTMVDNASLMKCRSPVQIDCSILLSFEPSLIEPQKESIVGGRFVVLLVELLC